MIGIEISWKMTFSEVKKKENMRQTSGYLFKGFHISKNEIWTMWHLNECIFPL